MLGEEMARPEDEATATHDDEATATHEDEATAMHEDEAIATPQTGKSAIEKVLSATSLVVLLILNENI